MLVFGARATTPSSVPSAARRWYVDHRLTRANDKPMQDMRSKEATER